MENPKILIVQFGSQFTDLIEQRLRERGYRSAVLPPKRAEEWLKANRPQAIILSGGKNSVYAKDAPTIADKIFRLGIPILGICYGMQFMAKSLGGSVEPVHDSKEYGPSFVDCENGPLFLGVGLGFDVWASHGDSVVRAPDSFSVIARARESGGIAGMMSADRAFFGLQFHPEVLDTPGGSQILVNFVASIAGCAKDWKPEDLISAVRSEVIEKTAGETAVILYSGGVDSTTLAAIASPVLGGKLKGLCLDFGQLRQGEPDEIRRHAEHANTALQIVNARERFAALCSGRPEPADPEEKRKLFRSAYKEAIEGALKGSGSAIFLQGTLAPDMIESGLTGGDCIKTHHNTGIDIPGVRQIFPFAKLFKYEVRALAKELDLSDSVVYRQPFPGPGLFIRIVGGWPTEERLEVLRFADAEVRRLVAEAGIGHDGISQLVIALPAVKVVGVKGDMRTHGYPIWVRGVKTLDYMTAKGFHFPEELWGKILSTLTRHDKIVTVMADEAPKPPRTIEFE